MAAAVVSVIISVLNEAAILRGVVCLDHISALSLGVDRLWRNLDYAVGAMLAGALADLLGMTVAIHVIAALMLLSGLVVALRMYETHERPA